MLDQTYFHRVGYSRRVYVETVYDALNLNVNDFTGQKKSSAMQN